MKTYKIIHDRENCIGCNACVVAAPENWEIDPKDGKSTLKHSVKKKKVFVGEIFDYEIEKNIQAKNACPMGIIKFSNQNSQISPRNPQGDYPHPKNN